MTPSYDDRQLACVRRTCPTCGLEKYMPPPQVICVACREGKL